MPTSTRSAFSSLVLVVAAAAAFTGVACGGFSSTESNDPDASSTGADDAPKAAPVIGTPSESELTEGFGVFVSPSGRADGDGSRGRPLATLQAGIALGKRTGKRVYACSGTFREAVVLADSISIIGGLTCSGGDFRFGGTRTRIEAPVSPALRAKDITSPTRLEGLDVVAPNATEPSGSSVGLLAERSAGLTIVSSTIAAGNARSGDDGVEGTALVQQGSTQGAGTVIEAECVNNVTCTLQSVAAILPWVKPAGGRGGTSRCAGAPGHDGLAGGNGGSGGLHVRFRESSGITHWHNYGELGANAPEAGQARPGTAGANGANGGEAPPVGGLSSDGYVPVAGAPGGDGAPGNGGAGGRGRAPWVNPATTRDGAVWRGAGGPGGGAGGCPGLAGTPGKGGGASIALALIDSPLTVDGSELVAGEGGAGGRGTFGSDPTAGGVAGTNMVDDASVAAGSGGSGGYPGISTNGGGGPSVGILHSGTAPSMRGGAKVTFGHGGSALNARKRFDAVGNARTIPASAAGIARAIIAL